MKCEEAQRKAEILNILIQLLKVALVASGIIVLFSIGLWVHVKVLSIQNNQNEIGRLWKHKAGGQQIVELHDRLERLELKVAEKHLYDPPKP